MNFLQRVSMRKDVEEYLKSSLKLAISKESHSSADEDETAKPDSFDTLCQTLATPPLFTVLRANCKQLSVKDARDQLQTILQEKYRNNKTGCPTVMIHPLLQDVLLVPGTGPHLDIIPAAKEIIVDSHCGVAVLRGADIFAPGVMGAHPGVQQGNLVSVFTDVEGHCRKGLTKPYNGTKIFLGNGRAVLSRNEIFCSGSPASGIAVHMEEPLYRAPSLNGVLPSALFLQNLPSIVTGHVLNPRPGDLVLDMCAAPGGKITHLASLMGDKGIIVALDKSKQKIGRILANCSRFGITCVKPFMFDATKSLDSCGEPAGQDAKGRPRIDAPPYPSQSFDRILLDAPCSALGQRPQTVVNMTLKELNSYPALQKNLFATAVELLKDGGFLVYSTCTITAEENENVVAWALQRFPCLELTVQSPLLGGMGYPNSGLSDYERTLVQRFYPTRHCDMKTSEETKALWDTDTIGFFIAKFVKNPIR